MQPLFCFIRGIRDIRGETSSEESCFVLECPGLANVRATWAETLATERACEADGPLIKTVPSESKTRE